MCVQRSLYRKKVSVEPEYHMVGLYRLGSGNGCMGVYSKSSVLNPMWSLTCGVLSMQCLVCKVHIQCAVYSVQCAVCSMQWVVLSM